MVFLQNLSIYVKYKAEWMLMDKAKIYYKIYKIFAIIDTLIDKLIKWYNIMCLICYTMLQSLAFLFIKN